MKTFVTESVELCVNIVKIEKIKRIFEKMKEKKKNTEKKVSERKICQ